MHYFSNNLVYMLNKKYDSIAELIAAYRVDRGVSIVDLAKQIGTSKQYAWEVEKGKRTYPVQFLKGFAKLLSESEKAILLEIIVKDIKKELNI